MDVYEFDKCLLDRLEESMEVLSWKDKVISSAHVHSEWSYYIELQIEPTGWQALWKIPRVICEEMSLRFPTVVFGTVDQVLFKEMKALFIIQAVQDDEVHLPERQEVNLADLWVTKMQENKEINADKTADCIDRMRFFYNHVWMPWDNDNDDDLNWVEKHLEARIRFCYDIKRKDMKRSLTAHIRTLLDEAKYLQQRREYLEIGLSDDEDFNVTLDKSQITDLMRLHLRLAMIKSEIEMLENPELRKIYNDTKFDDEKCLKRPLCLEGNEKEFKGTTNEKQIAYIVTVPIPLEKQIQFLSTIKNFITEDSRVQMSPSLQDVLNTCNASDEIFLPPGNHRIKFLEYLNDNGTITGLTDTNMLNCAADQSSNEEVIIMSPNDNSILLVFDGNFTIKNVTLNCRNIRTGILIKNGEIKLKNCRVIGDGKSSTQQGIVCCGRSVLTMEDCVVEYFSTGLMACDTATINICNSKIVGCRIGIDVDNKNARIQLDQTKILSSQKCGIYFETEELENNMSKNQQLHLKTLDDFQRYVTTNIPWSGQCYFEDCASNVFILNQKADKVFPKLNGDLGENDHDNKGRKRVLEISERMSSDSDCEVVEVINCSSEESYISNK